MEASAQEAFIRANQTAFNYGSSEEEGQVIAHDTVLMSLKHGQAYWIVQTW